MSKDSYFFIGTLVTSNFLATEKMAIPRLRSATLGSTCTFTTFHKTILGLIALGNAFSWSPCVAMAATDQSPSRPNSSAIAIFADLGSVEENLLSLGPPCTSNDNTRQLEIQTGPHGDNIHQTLNALVNDASMHASQTVEDYACTLSITTEEIGSPRSYYSQEALDSAWAIDDNRMIDGPQSQDSLTQTGWQKSTGTNRFMANSLDKPAPEPSTMASITGFTEVGLFTGLSLVGVGFAVNRLRKREKQKPEISTTLGVPPRQQ